MVGLFAKRRRRCVLDVLLRSIARRLGLILSKRIYFFCNLIYDFSSSFACKLPITYGIKPAEALMCRIELLLYFSSCYRVAIFKCFSQVTFETSYNQLSVLLFFCFDKHIPCHFILKNAAIGLSKSYHRFVM